MLQFSTLNDLILFAYSEPDLPDTDSCYKIISSDKKLQKKYNAIVKFKSYFNKIKVGPSDTVIKNIMNYSKALSVRKTKITGNISLLLN